MFACMLLLRPVYHWWIQMNEFVRVFYLFSILCVCVLRVIVIWRRLALKKGPVSSAKESPIALLASLDHTVVDRVVVVIVAAVVIRVCMLRTVCVCACVCVFIRRGRRGLSRVRARAQTQTHGRDGRSRRSIEERVRYVFDCVPLAKRHACTHTRGRIIHHCRS